MTPMTTILAARATVALLVAAGTLAVAASSANATSLAVKMACASDYYAHCSQFAPDTPGVRQCMRAHGNQLSKGCVDALVSAGEVSKVEVDRRRAAKKSFASKAKAPEARTAAIQ
jgi:hypothetical protein